MRKIMCVISGVSSSGGAERVMTVLCNEFARAGIEVSLVVQEPEKPFYPLDDAVKYLDTHVSSALPFVRPFKRNLRLRAVIRKEKPDIILSFMYPQNILTVLFSRGLSIPVTVSERIDPSKIAGTMIGRLRDFCYRLADGVVLQTQEAMDYFPQSIKDKATIIDNPLLDGIVKKDDYSSAYHISAVGRLTAQKNYKMMIDAFEKFHDKYHDYVLDIYGEGNARKELETLIASKGLEGKIILHGRKDDVHRRIRDSDFFVMTSDYEGMPNALAEAMAVGLPCISTNCDGGGAKRLIQNGVNGYLISKGDERSLIEYMEQLAQDRGLREKIGCEAKKIQAELNVSIIAERWIQFMDKFVEAED